MWPLVFKHNKLAWPKLCLGVCCIIQNRACCQSYFSPWDYSLTMAHHVNIWLWRQRCKQYGLRRPNSWRKSRQRNYCLAQGHRLVQTITFTHKCKTNNKPHTSY